ncbi:MAG: hypothetical protein EA356_12990 [Geminicoccaceae bacterium]|nr:MAG: hypothetical protein EA356_12990 [Geminicoccaceae bacterium]
MQRRAWAKRKIAAMGQPEASERWMRWTLMAIRAPNFSRTSEVAATHRRLGAGSNRWQSRTLVASDGPQVSSVNEM